MRVFGLWFGGANYSQPYLENHLEEFDSIEHAKRVFYSRRYGIHPQKTFYVGRENSLVEFPGVDESSELWLYLHEDPTDAHDPYPDRRLYWGPRGGLLEAPC